jgi:purine-binding chemotaxis protein CheW
MDKIKEIRENSKSYLTFKIGKEVFAAHVANVNNIIEVPHLTEIPDTPDYIKGVIDLRGTVLPVIDTCIKFKKQPIEFTSLTCVLVLDINHNGKIIPVGALVDSVNEVLEIGKEQILPPPEVDGLENANAFIEGMVKQEEQLIMLLNIDKLFDKKVLTDLSEKVKKSKQPVE